MHHVYTTPAFVVQSTPHGEAGKFLLLFTRDFGMIGAVAQGIRLSQSKLRYHTQDYAMTEVSVVRGKDVWRLTGAGMHDTDLKSISGAESKRLYVRMLVLLKRLLPGEEKNEHLFETVKGLYTFLTSKNIVVGMYEALERVTVLRVLHHLGYISSEPLFADILAQTAISQGDLQKAEELKAHMLREINRALKESQL